MPPTDDVRTTLARVEGMLAATLPQHAARLDEHDRDIAGLTSTARNHGERIAALDAVQQRQSQAPTWVPVAALLVSVAAVVATVIVALVSHG